MTKKQADGIILVDISNMQIQSVSVFVKDIYVNKLSKFFGSLQKLSSERKEKKTWLD